MPRLRAKKGSKRPGKEPYTKKGAREEDSRPSESVGGGDREPPEVVQLGTDQNRAGMVNPFERLFASHATPVQVENNDFALPPEAFKCADDSLTLHVANEIWQKIWSGDYINLAVLLKRSAETVHAPNLFVNEQGQIEMRAKQTKSVQNIREWTDAFLIFSAIIIKRHPEKANELLQYMALIREAEARCGGSLVGVTIEPKNHYCDSIDIQKVLLQ